MVIDVFIVFFIENNRKMVEFGRIPSNLVEFDGIYNISNLVRAALYF